MNKAAFLDGYLGRKGPSGGSLMAKAPTAQEQAAFQAAAQRLRAQRAKKKNKGTSQNLVNWKKDLEMALQ